MKPVEDQPIRLTQGKVYRWPDEMPPGWNTPEGTVPLVEADRLDWVRQSYEQKVDDLRRETLRCGRLVAENERLRALLDEFDRYASVGRGSADYLDSPFAGQVKAALGSDRTDRSE